jgi:hypothetical protein
MSLKCPEGPSVGFTKREDPKAGQPASRFKCSWSKKRFYHGEVTMAVGNPARQAGQTLRF